ncbi:MAG: ABC transporter permease [Burkholderiales bacterium]|nr:ABC transporter permease [Burkholderiales bacterium]
MNKPDHSALRAAKETRKDRLARWVLSAPPHVFLFVFLVLPALIMMLASVRYPGEFGGLAPLSHPAGAAGAAGLSADSYRFFVSDTIFLEIFLKSLLIALATTLICLLLAYPLALLIARQPKPRRDAMVLLVILPFASNFLIRIYAWIILLGPLNLLYSPFAVITGMVYVHLPFMVLPLYANLEQHDPLLLDAARDLGADVWQRFWKVTFPLSLPGIFSGGALVFIPVLGMFAVPELLGGTGDIMIGNLIKEQFLESRDWPFGATLSLILTVLVLAVAKLTATFTRRRRLA